ncbi:AbrB/MazE/SpoVT family DNA-binding domain-containing protein [Patescibacteria group bacterium]|nr:AbrB/MazE/SpoVT family DNA-binding domain-containing protein [Patescibacteria group bacterium]
MTKEEDPQQPFVGKKKTIRLGGSLAIVLPKSFIDTNNISEGDEVGLIADKDLLITTDDTIIDKVNKQLHEQAHKTIREFLENGESGEEKKKKEQEQHEEASKVG